MSPSADGSPSPIKTRPALRLPCKRMKRAKGLNSKQAMRTCGLVSRQADLISLPSSHTPTPPTGSHNGLIHPASAYMFSSAN